MIRYSFLLLLVTLISVLCFGQKPTDYYVGIAAGDSTQGLTLRFLSDSTVELGSLPRHMRPSIKAVYKYTASDTAIQVFPEPVIDQGDPPRGLRVPPLAVKTKMNLTRIRRGFIDYSRSLIYVRQKDFGNNPDLAYIIDGKTYIQDRGVTDGYGIVRKWSRTNKALQKKLKRFTKDNCTLEPVKGLRAYERFGIKRVYGVIIITSRR